MENEKRKSISVMIGGVHSFFPREMIKGIAQRAAEENLNAYFFLRVHTKPFFRSVLGDFSNNVYDYQFNTIHDYCRISGTDGAIVGYGTIGFHLHEDNSAAFARRYNHLPLVFVTEKVELPNCHNIISDNRQGMFQVIDHLVKVDGCRKILFMRGPRSNTDAIERYHGYLDAMASHGIPVHPDMVGIGDFSSYVDKEIERLLDANPDAEAFAFSNDEMASSCYRVCRKRGIRIGTDLKITGFDSGEFAEHLIPPLTSVFQDAYGMGARAVKDMAAILRGKKLDDSRFPVMLSVRESCGCASKVKEDENVPRDYASELRRIRYEAAAREQELLEYQGKSWFIPMMARELSDRVENETEYCHMVMEQLRLLKVNAAYLFLLDHSISYDGQREWECPDNLYLASYYRKGESLSYQPYDRPHVTPEQGIAQLTDDGEQHQFMVFLLFSGDRQYGLLACDAPVEELAFFYVVSLQLGLSLQYLELSQAQALRTRQMAQDIEIIRARNKELDMLSGYDHLSGLLNLRGITEKVRQLCTDPVSRNAYLMYIDLDHLKQINDYFGHTEGNFAITTCASILRSSFRETDLLARVGGDEFICLAFSEDPSFADIFRQRLADACSRFNDDSDKPFYVGMSVGIQNFTLDSYTSFQKAVSLADQKLYVAKKHRRADVRKIMPE